MRYSSPCPRSLAGALVGLVALMLPACQDFGQPGGTRFPFFPGGSQHVQAGEVAVRDGSEVQVCYPIPFQSPPRLTFTISQSYFRDKPFHESDFEIIKQDQTCFTVRNNHAEMNRNSWAVVKWRAEGIRASPGPQGNKSRQEQLIARVQRAGGTVARDIRIPGGPITGIDLHGTHTTDADLELLEGLTSLRSLNLYGTRITDAGLVHLTALTGMQALQLNSTAITDAGLQHLRGLTRLKQLGLYQTEVSDGGLVYLKSMAELEELSLSGPKITDQGLAQLKGLHSLHRLLLVHTRATPAAIQELGHAIPRLKITH
jgi:hypothetical protein